jgi:hypothetical protein
MVMLTKLHQLITTMNSATLQASSSIHAYQAASAHHNHELCHLAGIFVYSCLPSCIVVETMATLRNEDKHTMERVVDASFLAYVRCAFSTMDSALLGLASSGCGGCTVRVFDRNLHPMMPLSSRLCTA